MSCIACGKPASVLSTVVGQLLCPEHAAMPLADLAEDLADRCAALMGERDVALAELAEVRGQPRP